MLLVTLLVGEVINASTCRHVSDRAGSFSGPASGDYTLVIVCLPVGGSETEDVETMGSNELEG
ncbi:hypothetical protein SLEP1_g22173 [Rubroshorea leprosula]|uniref:Secreted protein n=1 Tax=Rubroshorea leprosula TaxID=152421 RepID=A0AAV5JHL9_9ROSI|nr:hypothetical protein SLEP1_g22173 [Rubroshorea leprosula]